MYLDILDITFGYHKQQTVIDGLSLHVKAGDIVALLGKSGSGKSTLLRLISGLETLRHGSISIDQEVVASDRIFIQPHQRKVGMVFQDYALFPHLNVFKNIAYGLNHLPKIAVEQRVIDMLQLIELEDKKSMYPHELSGGQQQRIALARALAPEPKILLMDEPFSNLDQDLRKMIRMELKSILKTSQTTTIIATHDYQDALEIADRIVYIQDGKIIKEDIVNTKKSSK